MAMPYRFAAEREDYSDYASGRVFYSLPGQTAFPVRLVSEIFQRCLAVRQAEGLTSPCVLYDPCCGGAYHLGALAFLHWPDVAEIIASDISAQALGLAERNLALLTRDGLDQRVTEITSLLELHSKASHADALKSAQRLGARLREMSQAHQISTRLFQADAIQPTALARGLNKVEIDVVIADVPYGQRSAWQTDDGAIEDAAWRMLDALRSVLSTRAVLAIAANKQQKITHQGYRRVGRFQIGKRRVMLLKPV